MKKTNFTVSVESEKLDALQFYTAKKDVDLQGELHTTIEKLYEKHVPQSTREYLEDKLVRESKPTKPQAKTSTKSTIPPTTTPSVTPPIN